MRYIKAITLISTLYLLAGCGGSSDPGALEIKEPKGGKLIADVPANLIKQDLLAKGLIDKNTTVFGYRAYKIVYTTTDEENKTVKASGVMVVPSAYKASAEAKEKLNLIKRVGFAMVTNCHGTIFANKEAPSVEIENSALPDSIGTIFSSISAFVTLQPDYIGFGKSKGHYHPYLLKKSSASSVADFIKAAIKFAKDNNIPLVASKDVYLTGYSQGGYVTLAAQEKIEKEGGINLKLSIPMAGPYLLDAIAANVLQLDSIKAPSFMAATAYSYSKAYKKDVSTLINEPYASKLPRLFSGKFTREQIDKELTKKVKGKNGLFTNYIVTNYQNSWFKKALANNSVVNFVPKAPVTLLHCLGDDIVNYQVVKGALDTFNYLGANSVELLPVEVAITKDINTKLRLGHIDCALPAYKIATTIFAKYRLNTIGY